MTLVAFVLGLILGFSAAALIALNRLAAGREVVLIDCPSTEEEVLP